MTTTKIIDSVVLYAKRQRVCIGRVDRSMEARWAGRFAEPATADGLKMHRSFWVARDAVVVAERNGGKY